MFADAYEKAMHFTQPLIVATRHFDGTLKTSVGAFLILNREGWVMTVAHMLEVVPLSQKDSQEFALYQEQQNAIQNDTSLTPKQKRKRISRLRANPQWITDYRIWWGKYKMVQSLELKVLPEADLAVVRLEPFDPDATQVYPVLKNHDRLRPGTSLCKLGYPFHGVEVTFHEEDKSFEFAPGALPIPRFPIEGIYTRNAVKGKSENGKYEIKFLETSSPGLKGQSGGPIFDRNGTVWAIQSRTGHIPLGFSPRIKKQGREVEENQFLNVGLGIHPELLIAFLKDNGIKFELSDY